LIEQANTVAKGDLLFKMAFLFKLTRNDEFRHHG